MILLIKLGTFGFATFSDARLSHRKLCGFVGSGTAQIWRSQQRWQQSGRLQMNAASFGAAYEWLAKERDGSEKGPVSSILWFDPTSHFTTIARETWGEERLPLYPLGASYVPSGALQKLNNVEPRNIRMAQDLKEKKWDGRFCVALMASDTGRVATVGTVMRIVEMDEQYGYDGTLSRIVVQCIAEELVEIVSLENPEAWKKEKRLLKSNEYLVARVRSMPKEKSSGNDQENDDGVCVDSYEAHHIVQELIDDYEAVRSMYCNTQGVADTELPPFAVDAVKKLPAWNLTELSDSKQFWKAAEIWQTLCYTVREGHKSTLHANINEIMISEAIKKGGPLKLPVHRTDLSRDIQQRLERMEEEAAREFIELGLDPCLDFQALISTPTHKDRLRILKKMVASERQRLEAKQRLKPIFMKPNNDKKKRNKWQDKDNSFE
eukprot:scaffold4893_cov58-Attheya_sp.AAC.1